jgi:hypothetical protein
MTEDEEKPARPRGLPVDERQVPHRLKTLPRWVGWRYEFREGAWTRVPDDCRTCLRADVARRREGPCAGGGLVLPQPWR